MLKIGDKLPGFDLPNQDGELVKKTDFKGKKLVIFFYPQAGTPTCTVEVCNLRDGYSELQKNGFELIGVSADPVSKLKKFQEKHQLPFDLLSDEERKMLEAFGVWQQKTTFGKTYMGILRTTFVFNEKGVCVKVIDKVKSKEAAQQILDDTASV